jgi:hypothetical protein
MKHLKDISLKDFADKKRWKDLGKTAGDLQVMFKLGHMNPEYNADPMYSQPNKIIKEEKKGNVIETTSTVGISTKRGTLSDYHDVMIQYAQMGLLGDFTVDRMKKHREEMNIHMPEECDFWTDISVADHTEESIASRVLENITTQFTKGFANIPVPGASGDMTVQEIFKDALVIEEARKRGVDREEIEKALEKINEASQQAVVQAHNSDMKYVPGKFDTFPAVYVIPPSPSSSKNKRKNKKDKKRAAKTSRSSSKTLTGGGGSDTRVKLPPDAYKKEDYPIDGKLLQTIQVGRYILTGSILTALHCMPSGKLYCQSLTKFKTVTEKTRIDGMTHIDNFIIPLDSTLKEEGYMTREETKEMILKLISLLP